MRPKKEQTMSTYRGDSPGKAVNREMVWLQHQAMLGDDFSQLPHVFLASKYACDIDMLSSMKVPLRNIWAVEKDSEQYRSLRDKGNIKIYTMSIEEVSNKYPQHMRSVYLDFCGNLQGARKTINKVINNVPPNSVVSITLFKGREYKMKGKREANLLKIIGESSKHPYHLVQKIAYKSTTEKSKGSLMQTWTIYFGSLEHSCGMKFDLTTIDKKVNVQKLWQTAKNRSYGAVKANIPRKAVSHSPIKLL